MHAPEIHLETHKHRHDDQYGTLHKDDDRTSDHETDDERYTAHWRHTYPLDKPRAKLVDESEASEARAEKHVHNEKSRDEELNSISFWKSWSGS